MERLKDAVRSRWLIYLLLFAKMIIYYWQTDMLDMMNIFHYIRVLLSGEDVPAYELICVYEAPIITFLILVCIYELGAFRESRIRKIVFAVLFSLVSLLMFADAAYSGYFGKTISVNQLFQLGSFLTIAGDGDVISGTFSPGCLLTLADCPLVLYLFFHRRQKDSGSREEKKRILPRLLHILLIILCAGLWYYYSFNPANSRDVQRVNHIEFFTSHTNDILVNVVSRWKKANVDQDQLKETMKDLVPESEGDDYRGIAKGRNLILIQTESLNNFVVGASYNDQELTPNMNKLIEEDSFYFDRFFSTTGIGNTCDAEFSVLNSLYPNNVRECYRMYVDNTYNGLPWLLQDQGYDTLAFHGYLKTFWNRNEAYKNQGIRKFYSQEKLEMTEKSGFGLTDKEMFRQAVDILREEEGPFFSFMITLTNHIPYELDPSLASLSLKAEDSHSLFGHYLQTVHYTDEAFGDLIRYLKENDLYDNSIIVIYGDHQGLNLETAAVKKDMTRYLGRDYDYDEMLRVPLLIHIPGLKESKRVHTVGGQIDIMPTLANLMDLDIEGSYVLGHDLLNAREGYVAQISYVGVGSFIGGEKDRLFVIGKDGTVESGRMLSIDSGKELPMDLSYCRVNSERAASLVRLSQEILDNNLIQRKKH